MKNMEKLIEIMATLRGPDGCPWDKEQDHKSLKPYLIEEAHEVLTAIDENDDEMLSEELGDLLSQIIMHAQLGKDREAFDIEVVAGKIVEKLTIRHPHVFGKKEKLSSGEVLENWERIKLKNSKTKNYSVLQGVPPSLPALLKAFRIQEKVGRYGFDWTEASEVTEKVKEEIAEFEEAVKAADKEKIENEFGDLLFSLVNLGRHLGLQAEESLNGSIRKFTKRFQYIEEKLRENGKTLVESNLEEMDALWEEAKTKI